MALTTATREISGKTYRVTQLGTADGLRLFFKLGKLVGPSVAALLREWQGGKINAGTAAGALTEFVAQLEWPDLQEFVKTFAKVSAVALQAEDGERWVPLEKTIDTTAFAGDYLALFQWLGFCLEHNFASFFAGLGATKLPSSPATA